MCFNMKIGLYNFIENCSVEVMVFHTVQDVLRNQNKLINWTFYHEKVNASIGIEKILKRHLFP